MNNFKTVLSISLLTLAISTAHAQENNINAQKSEIRTQSSFIQLENSKLEREQANLNLQITIEQLRRELENIRNQESSDGTLTVEEYRDSMLSRGSSDEIRAGSKGAEGIGTPSQNRRTATQLNQRDIQNRSLGGVQVIGEDGESTGINIDAINNLIQSAIDERASEFRQQNTQPERSFFENQFDFQIQEDEEDELSQENVQERNSGRLPANSNVSIDEVEVLKVLERGNIKRATLNLTLDAELPNGSNRKIEDFRVDIEEGQIYTWYDKVYEVRSISVRTIILFNATDNEEIVTHL